ncbi:MAG: hypothetical protein ACWGNV_14870 [Bacteroidales bacterium]
MNKFIHLFTAAFITIVITTPLTAQSPSTALDQVELMKQFVGTWQAEPGEDTTIMVTFQAYGIALDYNRVVTIKVPDGTHEYYLSGIYGFAEDMSSVIFAGVEPGGSMIFDYGRFVSESNYVSESYSGNEKHPIALEEVEFISPDSMQVRSRYRGDILTWDVPWTPVVTFIRQE